MRALTTRSYIFRPSHPYRCVSQIRVEHTYTVQHAGFPFPYTSGDSIIRAIAVHFVSYETLGTKLTTPA